MGIQRNRSDLFTAEGIEKFNGCDHFNCFIKNCLILISQLEYYLGMHL